MSDDERDDAGSVSDGEEMTWETPMPPPEVEEQSDVEDGSEPRRR